MKKVIVIINGTGGCGKDTFVKFASEYAQVDNFSSVTKIKEVARQLGWQGQKEEKDRKFLSDLKKITTEYNDLSFQELKKKVASFQASSNWLLFLHIKEIPEIERAVKEFQAKTLLIKRKNHPNLLSNDSDRYVDCYSYDDVLSNDSLEQLKEEAKNYIEKLKKEE